MRNSIPTPTVRAFGVLAACIGASIAQASEDASSPQLWLERVSALNESDVVLRVEPAVHTPSTHEVLLAVETIATREQGDLTIVLSVVGPDGAVRHSAMADSYIDAGVDSFQFSWNTEAFEEGNYEVEVSLRSPTGRILSRHDLVLTKLSAGAVANRLDRAAARMNDLLNHLADGSGAEVARTRAELRLRVCEYFLQDAQTSTDLRRKNRISSFVNEVVDSVRAHLAFAPIVQAENWIDDYSRIETRDGAFYIGNRPQILSGMHGKDLSTEYLERVRRLGMGMVVSSSVDNPADYLRRAQESQLFPAVVVPIREEMTRPSGAPATSPGPYLVGAPLKGAALEPQVDAFRKGELLSGFHERLRDRYGDRYTLNRVWRTRFEDIEEIGIWPDYPKAAYQYDWTTYYQEHVLAYLASAVDRMRSAFPAGATAFLYEPDLAAPAAGSRGIDYAATAELVDVVGVRLRPPLADPSYSIAYPDASLLTALMHSLAPSKPILAIVDLPSAERIHHLRNPRNDIATIYWDLAIEGADAVAWTSQTLGSVAPAEFLSNPGALEGLVLTNHDGNRNAAVIQAFHDAPCEVAVLWSESSRLYERGSTYLPSLARAYAGVSFFGYNVRFITEKELASADYANVKLIVVPHTPALSEGAYRGLESFIADGGTVIRSAMPTPYDPWGQPHKEYLSLRGRVALVRENDASTLYLDAMDGVFVGSGLSHIPRSINAFGYPLEGVKSRYVKWNSESYLYLVNLREEAVSCHLYGGNRTGYDLIGATRVTFPKILPSMQPMLIRLDPTEDEQPVPLQEFEPVTETGGS